MTDRTDIGAVGGEQELRAYLHDRGLRYSAERLEILECIRSMERLFSPEELFEAVSERQNFRLSRATVYNNLHVFESVGLVQRVLLEGNVRYDRGWHGNCSTRLVCRKCQKTVDCHDDRLDRLVPDMKMKRFRMEGFTLYVYGLCSRCAQIEKRKKVSKN